MQVNKYKHPSTCFPEFYKPDEIVDNLDITDKIKQPQHTTTIKNLTKFDEFVVKFLGGSNKEDGTRVNRCNSEYLPRVGAGSGSIKSELHSD